MSEQVSEHPETIIVADLWEQWDVWKPRIDSGECTIGELDSITRLEPRGSSDFLFYANGDELLKSHYELEIVWHKPSYADLQRELREAQADAAVLQEALEYYGVLDDSAFRTHKSGAELLRELDTLKDQDAKLVAALESIRGAQVTGDFGAEAVLEEVRQTAQEALKGENDE